MKMSKTKAEEFIEGLRDCLNTPKKGTVSYQALTLGIQKEEPIIEGLLHALDFAMSYEERYEGKLKDDYALGSSYLCWISGMRGLLNGMGGVAMRHGVTTDSKDDSWCESLFWECMKASGFQEEDL